MFDNVNDTVATIIDVIRIMSIIGFLLLIFMLPIVGLAITSNYYKCSELQELSDMQESDKEYTWGFFTGCTVNVNGYQIPVNNIGVQNNNVVILEEE